MLSSGKRASCFQVRITKVEQISQFIKITAQNLNDADYIQLTNGLENIYESSSRVLRDEELGLGETFVTKFNDSYARCRILDSDDFSSVALVDFIDLGRHGRVRYGDLRAFPERSEIRTLPSTSKEFILGELLITQHDALKVKRLEDLITNKCASMMILGQNDLGKFVDLHFADSSLARDIVLKHPVLNTIFEFISVEDQMKLMVEKRSIAPVEEARATLKAATEYPLSAQFGSSGKCSVVISAYIKGPEVFSVQLVESLQKLQDLKINLQSKKQSFKHVPNPQMNDTYAVVFNHNIVDRAEIKEKISEYLYVIRLVDTGISRVINLAQICELPAELKTEPFAWKFALSGIEEITHLKSNEINFYFHYLTRGKTLKLQLVKKAESKDGTNLCSLYDGEADILELFKKYNPRTLTYPPQEPLSVGTSLKAKISSFESPKLFYINVLTDDIASKLSKDFELYCGCRFDSPVKDSVCLVKINGKNYRGTVLKPLSPFTVTCQLVDLGQIDYFSGDEVKVMVDEFTKHPPMAYKCTLYGLDNSKLNLDVAKSFKDICTRNQSFSVELKEFKNGIYYVTLETEDKKDVLGEILKSPFMNYLTMPPTRRIAIRKQRSNSFRINLPSETPEPLDLNQMNWSEESGQSKNESWSSLESTGEKCHDDDIAVITSVESPTDFMVQLKSSFPDMESFFTALQELGEKGDPLITFEKNELCLVKNPYTKEWRRAMIVNTDFNEKDKLIKLKNVDDGVCYELDNPTELKKYPFACVTIAHFGIRCALPVKVSKKSLFEATEVLMHLIGQDIKYKLICANAFFNIIDIIASDGKSAVNELVRADLASKLEYITSGTGCVVHIEDLSEFYIQLDQEIGMINALKFYGTTYERKPLVKPNVNKIIMAKSSINNCWARAKILAIVNDDFEVKFIDYGYTEKVYLDDTGEICNQFALMEPLAYCCSLFMPARFSRKTAAAVKRFKEVTKEKNLHFKMMVSTKNRSVVQLLVDTKDGDMKNIGNELITLSDVAEKLSESNDISSILDSDSC